MYEAVAMMPTQMSPSSELHLQPWKTCAAQVQALVSSRRGKAYRPRLLVAAAANSAEAPPEWLGFAERILRQTLRQLLGPGVAIEPLLERALPEAALAWPPARPDEPLSIGLQRIATAIAIRHLRAKPASSSIGAEERSGGMRELLIGVYTALRELPTEDSVAFALIELGGHSPAEAAAVIGVPPHILEQRARRARCRLLFAARRDVLVLRYLRLAARWRALSRRTDQKALRSLYGHALTGTHANTGLPAIDSQLDAGSRSVD